MACRICGDVKPNAPLDELCDCVCRDCQEEMLVFADLTDSDPKKNDQTEFLFRVLDVADTAALKLFKDGVEVADLNSGAFGTFFDLGTMGDGTIPDQQFYIGYFLAWNNVASAFGFGKYYVKAEMNILGNAVESFSAIYNLTPYSKEGADGTVRISSIMNGNIESSPFDMTDLEWQQQIRVKGIFWNKQPTFTTDTYFSTNLTVNQIQDSVAYSYNLETQFLSATFSDYLTLKIALANEIFVTDYNCCNTEDYLELPVVVQEFDETSEFTQKRGRTHIVIFGDRVQNHRKRNFK